MKKILLGVILVASIASVAFALPWMVTATSTNVKGWTISVPGAPTSIPNVANQGDSGSGFYIQWSGTAPATGGYYCKADSTGKASRYYGWWWYDVTYGDTQLGAITFGTRLPANPY
ncbi:hypothetical protein HZA73_08815 [candidate division TA06 bacterium]|nr:hypothetical protein [candidate division TA06 bacterium]